MYLANLNPSIVMMIVWVAVFISCLIIEVSTMQLVSIWFCGGSFVNIFLAVFDVKMYIQFIVFTIVSAILLILSRPFVKKKLLQKTIKTNSDSLIGREVILNEDVDIDTLSSCKISSITWSVVVDEDISMKQGDHAIIKEIKGNKLVVTKKGE